VIESKTEKLKPCFLFCIRKRFRHLGISAESNVSVVDLDVQKGVLKMVLEEVIRAL